jgi:hypothetical protein
VEERLKLKSVHCRFSELVVVRDGIRFLGIFGDVLNARDPRLQFVR